MSSFKKIRNSIASVVLAVASASSAAPPARSLPALMETSSPPSLSRLECALNLAGSYALTVGWHELGHYTMAKSLGFEDIELHGPSLDKGAVARVSYDQTYPRQPDWRVGLARGGGFIFTTTGSVLLTQLLKNNLLPASARSFTATTSLLMLAERHVALWSSAMKNYLRTEKAPSDDVDHLLKLSFDQQSTIDIAYGLALGASILELSLRDKELGYLICTAFGLREGIPECRKEYSSGSSWQPVVYPIGEGVMMGVSGKVF